MPETKIDAGLLFLETTVQIERVIGPQATRDLIRRNIRQHRACTSGHVLGEYKRTLIKDAVTFLNLVKSSPTVSEAIKRLAKYHSYGRGISRTIALLATLGFDEDKDNTIDRIELFIEWRAIEHFWEGIDRSHYHDKVRCVLRSWEPSASHNGTYQTDGLKCLKNSPPNCSVQEFIRAHRVELQKLASSVVNHDRRNVKRAGQALTSILEGEDVPFGERSNCPIISDALIVLESPSESLVYTTDGDIKDICAVLGRQVYKEDPATART